MLSTRRSFFLGVLLALVSVGLVVAVPVFAQVDLVNLEKFASAAGFQTQATVQEIIVRLIRTVLSFVGVILVIMILYGGFKWMTSGGDQKRLGDAKKILTQAIIGAIITLSAFVIVQFVLNKIVEATGKVITTDNPPPPIIDINPFSTFSLKSVNTQCASALRNLQVQLVFTKPVDPTTIIDNIGVKVKGADFVEGTLQTNGSLVTFTPTTPCPAPNQQAFCFGAKTVYEIVLNSSAIKSKDGSDLTCSAGSIWCNNIPFHTGSGIDLTGPTLSMQAPQTGQSVTVSTIKQLQTNTQDDTGVSTVEFFVVDDDEPIFVSGLDLSTEKKIVGGQAPNQFFTDENVEWNTAGYLTNKSYPIWAMASDCAGNTVKAPTVYPIVRAAHCDNTTQDDAFGETGVNCGGDVTSPEYCGACANQECEENADCASGVCEGGVCVSKPRIDIVSPGDGAVGNLVTIGGNGFGAQGGTVRFIGSQGQQSVDVSAYQCEGQTQWSDSEIVIQIPTGATDGPLEVITNDQKSDRTDDVYGPIFSPFDVNAIKRPGLCLVNPSQGVQGSQTTFYGLAFGEVVGSSALYFKNYPVSTFSSWTENQINASVPNMTSGNVSTQVFTGDFRCLNAQGVDMGTACLEDEDCGAGNTCAQSWCSETLAYCSTDEMCGVNGGECVSVRVGSNKLQFQVQDPGGPETVPQISYVDSGWKACEGGSNAGNVCGKNDDCPASSCEQQQQWGPKGQYITIYGSNFGSAVDTVHFKIGLGVDTIGDAQFPEQCTGFFWTDTAITIKVPDVSIGDYQLSVKQSSKESNSVDFKVVSGSPGPALCALDPVSGPEGTEVDFYGEHLGEQHGFVNFYQNKKASSYTIWSDEQITDALVPDGASTGPVALETNDGFSSNSLNFRVGSCPAEVSCQLGTQCCGDGTCQIECDGPPPSSHFAYRISTDEIPEYPHVLEVCDANTISPSPWSVWPDSASVCLNAAATATFSVQMDQSTLPNKVWLEKCLTPGATTECNNWAQVTTTIKTSETAFKLEPTQLLSANTLHRVTILGGNQGVKTHPDQGSASLQENYSWQFLTGGSSEVCKVGNVLVSPSEFTATEQGQTVDYWGVPVAAGKQCIVLSSQGSEFAWSSDFWGAEVQPPTQGLGQDSADVNANEQTTGNPAKIQAQILNAPNQPSDTGDLTINFSDPSVEAYFPICTSACINVKPWFRMKSDLLEETLTTTSVNLLKCKNALCILEEINPQNLISSVTCTKSPAKPNVCEKGMPIYLNTTSNLSANSWYRVWLNGDMIKSPSNVLLKESGSNYGTEQNLVLPNAFSWKFKTSASDVACSIGSISVAPKIKTLKAIGNRQSYVATPYSVPDSCDSSGQALQDANYTWQAWSAKDTPDSFIAADGGSEQDVAFLWNSGSIETAKTIPAYCTSTCQNTGTPIKVTNAICGDGVINGVGKIPSEECDGGSNCGPTCLLTGSAVCAEGQGSGCCGNGTVEVTAGEQCDDGNISSGDGCSSSCLNEGSSSIGAICGDGVALDPLKQVDFFPKTGGEDCDDGNNKNGDGCSSSCLFEGSNVQGPYGTCGNGGSPQAGEDCDDGNAIPGDGCSEQCLNEGTPVCAFVCSDNKQTCQSTLDCVGTATCDPINPICCGNGGSPQTGEDCDDGNSVSGDGCSSQCLLEGSSISYSNPSFCGDGVKQIGEQCEVGTGQTFQVGGYALAQISPNAPKEVGIDGGTAYSVITASADGKFDTATLGIECSCQTDQACGSSETLGCGSGSCCFERPELLEVLPAEAPSKAFCRNTAVSVEFDQTMDLTSFVAPEGSNVGNVRLRLVSIDDKPITANPSLCPSAYTKIALTQPASGNIFVRAWNWLRSLFGYEVTAAALAGCYADLKFTAIETTDGQKLNIDYGDILEPNAVYHLHIEGDNDSTDAMVNGVRSENQVGLCLSPSGSSCSSLFIRNFKTNTEICVLDAVDVTDHGKVTKQLYEEASPNFFTSKEEEHIFEAAALTYHEGQGTTEQIIPTTSYSWAWSWGSSISDTQTTANIVSHDTGATLPGHKAQFFASGINGMEQVIATATISKDLVSKTSTLGEQISGSTEITALVCERPWPDPNSALGFPYIENKGSVPSNFGFYYCMDKGQPGIEEDLPALEEPVDVTSVSGIGGLFQELLFKVQGTPDAIGVRVIQNPTYLSPEAWFKAQNFTSGYTKMEMDGYQAVKSGTTAYVAAANQNNQILYSNIYVVSYNPNAGTEAKEIFDQILANWRFNANTDVIQNVGLCKVGGAYQKNVAGEFIECSWDGECIESFINQECSVTKLPQKSKAGLLFCPLDVSWDPYCNNTKAEIQRDLQRLTDLTTQIVTLNTYGSNNKHCSVTKEMSCSVSEQCPGTESCVAGYPTLQAGTYIPSMSVSTWESWNAELSNAVGSALATDPLNVYWKNCDLGNGYDPATCFNGLQNTFVCPASSHVYAYQNIGQETYRLFAQLEYAKAPWNDKIDQFPDDDVQVIVEYSDTAPPGSLPSGFTTSSQFCASTQVWGVSGICGDGVLGTGEKCEPGQTDLLACTTGSPAKTGKISVTCKDDCKGFQTEAQAKSAGAECVPEQCGNGIKETVEECDDGVLNGTYGHCGSDCTFASGFVCGDGYLAGGEQCDCGTPANKASISIDPNSWKNLSDQNKKMCGVSNGQYRVSASCSYDCKIPGPSCGDKEVNGPEECDGTKETWAGKLCTDKKTVCTKNSDCPSGYVCDGTSPETQACTTSRICEGGSNQGHPCSLDAHCLGGGTCSKSEYPLARRRTCGKACIWPGWSVCLGGNQLCGNGTIEGNEECDDGNTSNNDSCTNTCKQNVCSDGFLYSGVEACDNGDNNLVPKTTNPCSAPYGGTCNYCTTQCQYQSYSGSFCGDGKINGDEFCDGTAVPKRCWDKGKKEMSNVCTSNTDCTGDLVCANVGVCNGGQNNGKNCTVDNHCPDAACVKPVCANDCSSSCPHVYQTTSVLIESELPGSQPQQSIDLYSYLNQQQLSPDNALLHLPACLAGTKITANIENKVTLPEVDVVFVTDLSGSMAYSPGGNEATKAPNRRIDIVAEATKEAIDTLFSSYPQEKLRVGLVSYQGTKVYDDVADAPNTNGSLLKNDAANKQILKSIVSGYPSKVDAGTPTGLGVKEAIKILDDSPGDRIKIVVLLSDGNPSFDLNAQDCSGKQGLTIQTEAGAKSFSEADWCTAQVRYAQEMIKETESSDPLMFFYSAAIATGDKLKAYMAHMSSEECKGKSMSDLHDCTQGTYAFTAKTKEGILEMYKQVIGSILSSTTTVTYQKQAQPGITPVGTNIQLPIPESFECQSEPFTMPIRTQFYGTGTMKFDNITFTYCPLSP